MPFRPAPVRNRSQIVFRRFRKLSSAVIADIRPNAPIQCPPALPESDGRRGASVALGNHPISSGFLRRISSRTSRRFRRRKKTGTSRLHTFDTFMRPYALRMQPYAVRMHFFGSSKKLGGSRAESTCKKPYALYAPLLGVGVFSAFFLLRELHTVHTVCIRKPLESGLSPTARRH